MGRSDANKLSCASAGMLMMNVKSPNALVSRRNIRTRKVLGDEC